MKSDLSMEAGSQKQVDENAKHGEQEGSGQILGRAEDAYLRGERLDGRQDCPGNGEFSKQGSERNEHAHAIAGTVDCDTPGKEEGKAVQRVADAASVLQGGRLSIYLLFSFLTLLGLLLFVL